VREIRGRMNISPGRRSPVLLKDASGEDRALSTRHHDWLERLAGLESITLLGAGERAPPSAPALVGSLTVLVPLAGLIDAAADAATLARALDTLETVILGKPAQIRLCLACLLARGHLLIEDVPGVGKTTLAHALAHVLGLLWQRVQFTSDLLPADIIGVSIFDRASQRFNFRQGPVFTQLLLADEVNRASPRTQSALLEAMEERQVSADGTTYPLPEPFFVVATQNPHEQLGTFALPESQLDRFLMR